MGGGARHDGGAAAFEFGYKWGDYMPRNCKLDNFSNQDIEDITWTYNPTPRKCLGFPTPIEAFAKLIGGAVEI